MKNFTKPVLVSFFFILFSCTSSSAVMLPSNFNNCQVSLDDALKELQELKSSNELDFEIRIVREITDREECLDMVLGTNLPQGSELENGKLVDLVVGIKKNETTDTIKETEYELYLQKLNDKNLTDLNLLTSPVFGSSNVNQLIENQELITYIKSENPLNYKFLFSEAQGIIYGVDEKNNVIKLLDISIKTVREKESGLHTFDFVKFDSSNYLLLTYSGTDGNYYLSAFEVLSENEVGEEIVLIVFELQNDNNVHFGGKILQEEDNLFLCLGDLNSPGNSAKFDSPWGKVMYFNKNDLFETPITSHDDPRINYIVYGLRNPWSCFEHNDKLVIPDVGSIHWEEVNILSNYLNAEEPVFLGWPWLESYFDANYKNTPVDEQTKQNQLENAVFPQYTYPHANDYCAIIGGTELFSSEKWDGYFFIGDFCTGTIWAINVEKESDIVVLEKNIVPFSITTINDSGNGALLVGTTAGSILEITLP